MDYTAWLKELDYELDRRELGAEREDFPEWDWERMFRAGATPQDVAESVIACKYKKDNQHKPRKGVRDEHVL